MSNEKTKKARAYPSQRKSKVITAKKDFKLNSEYIIEVCSLTIQKLKKKAELATYSLNEQVLIARSLSQLQTILHNEEMFLLTKQTRELELEKLRKQVDMFEKMSDAELKELVEQAATYLKVAK